MQTRLLDWYDINARVLPWRSDPSPYKVWLSEIMLQQTRVDTVLPYFERFLDRFPTLQSLAESQLDEVLRLWEGLGYYSRARNLHKAAVLVQSDFAGKIPGCAEELEKLPGIGNYTAAAIASIAFGEPVAAVDGNIKRIYSRVLALQDPLGTASFNKTITDYAQSVLPQKRAGDFNQALRDLGSMICLPIQPACSRCPLQPFCKAYELGMQETLPQVLRKAPIPHYDICVAVIWHEGRILLAQRGEKGMLTRLWEYPGGKVNPSDTEKEKRLQDVIQQKTGLQIAPTNKIGTFKHAYTHFRISVHAWHAEPVLPLSLTLPANLRWVLPEDLPDYPMGKVARRISDQIHSELIRAKNQ